MISTRFARLAVELAVEDLFPRAEVELAVGDGDDDLAAHDLAFHVGVGVVFAGAVVMVARGRRIEGGELLQPLLVVFVQPRLVVVDEHAGGDVHGVHQEYLVTVPISACGDHTSGERVCYSPMTLISTRFGAAAVELAVENLLPRAEVELALR